MTRVDARAAQPPALDGVTDYRIIGRPRPLMWVATAVVIALAAMVVYSIVTNPRFEWDVVATYFFSTSVLNGLWKTIELTVVAMVIGIVIGLVIALMRISSNRVLNAVAGVYVWFFRGTPLLVQLVILYNISALYPSISIGIPFGPTFFEGSVNQIVTPYIVAVAALALNEAAYMAEIIRGGLLSVDHGQLEASRALGMSGSRAMRRIVIPQAMRFIIPPTGNEVLSLLKSTSLVSVIALPELLYSVQVVYSRTFETIPLLMVATIWYLIVTSILMVGQQVLERFYARGSSRASGAGSLQRLTGIRFRRRAASAAQSRAASAAQTGEER